MQRSPLQQLRSELDDLRGEFRNLEVLLRARPEVPPDVELQHRLAAVEDKVRHLESRAKDLLKR